MDLSTFLSVFLWGGDLPGPAGGLAANVMAFAVAFSCGWLAAVPLALLRYAQLPVIGASIHALVLLIRGIPVLLLAFWFHVVLPLVSGQPAQAFVSAVWALGLYAAVSLSDMMLTGARSIAAAEVESARGLGLSPLTILRAIVLPQMLERSVGSTASFATTLFKDTSILYIVGVSDVLHIAMIAGERNPQNLGIYYVAVALSYVVVCTAISAVGAAAIRRVQRRNRQGPVTASPRPAHARS
jgi:His/Glu/Gln/Arg/opine family amino acid ABC transporter permease subunit